MTSTQSKGPVNPLPPVVAAMFLILVGIEVVFQLGAHGLAGGPEAIGWRQEVANRYSLSTEMVRWMWETRQTPPELLVRLVSYPFVNMTFTQTLIAGVMLLAMGKLVTETCGTLAFLAVFFVSTIVGALAFGLVISQQAWLFGAFPPVYGLIGTFTYLLWQRLAAVGAHQARAFSLIGMLMAIRLLFGLLFGLDYDWVADLAAFTTGFLLSFVVAPGAWARLVSRIRQE